MATMASGLSAAVATSFIVAASAFVATPGPALGVGGGHQRFRGRHGSAAAAAASGEVRMSAAADARTVVVTGLGVVSGVGTGVEAFWEGLLKGESSVNRIEGFDPERFKCQIGSEVKDFDASQYFTAKKSVRSNDRVTHFAVAATKLAIEDAGVDVEACGERCGVMVSEEK